MVFIWGFLIIIISYLSGSLCSAIIVCRIFNLSDPREGGSGNPGATNVLRLHGKKYAAMVLLGDMLKGTIPVLLARLADMPTVFLGWAALVAVSGHMFPIFFKFHGGKGVATALGSFFGMNLFLGAICLALWVIVAKVLKYSSVASIVMVLFAPIVAVITLVNSGIFLPMLLMALMIIAQHRENIQRLTKGEESKIKF
ncbi:MAG: glycerol-3-phosphate 1-O-acyltransferase [Gammaproteobacteria bacterium]|nr:glycerol-3-phosphate 1-O-acyltransferase [Gammaproteobacteria bacterium]